MKKLVFILFFYSSCFSQVNTDSLLQSLQQNYEQTRTRNYLMKDFLVYETMDKRDRYDVYIDSTQQLGEYIGLAIVHYQYDSLNRVTLIEGFGKKGELRYWDFPPRTVYFYSNDTIVPQLHRVKNELCNCISPDSIGYIRTETEYYFAPNIPDRIRTDEISKDSLMKVLYVNEFDGSYMHNREYVVFQFREYEKTDKKFIVQERFYDKNFELIDKTHDICSTDNSSRSSMVEYAYSIRETTNLGIGKMLFYNSKHEIVDEAENDSIIQDSGPINMPGPPLTKGQKRRDERWANRQLKKYNSKIK